MNLVEEAIRSWELARAGTIAELENIPESSFDHRVAEQSRTIAEVARHIAEAGHYFVAQLLAPEPRFAAFLDPAQQEALHAQLPAGASKAELVELLRRTGAEGATALRERGEALAAETMPSMGGPQSRLTGLYFAVSHEGYHRGQLALLSRSVGRVPALTQQIESRRRKA